jgi:hypothetical protein
MKRRSYLASLGAAGGLALILLASPAAAQVDLGRIDLLAEDTTGAVLPGASVAITGPEDRSDIFTDVQGEAHLLRLPVGTYEVRITLPGFSAYVDTAVQVRAASATPMVATLEVGGIDETVTVTGVSPIIDPRRQSTDTHVTVEELQEIPSARDPWVVLQTIPGVIVDRVNVGGAESGQQSNYMAKGASSNENTWTLDGVVITDMASLSSPTYWDFDQFQEVRINTGGADVRNQTPGAAVDVVLKSGSNQYHGSVRGYFANESMQRNNLSPELAESIGGQTGRGNRMEQYRDYGFEVGGPLIKDRMWAWGSLGETDIRLRTLIDTADRTTLTNRALKVQGQVTDGVRLGFNHFNGAKVKLGRNASPTRPDETTWNQGGLGSGLYTGSGNWVGSDLVVSAKGSVYNNGFSLTPRGGLDVEGVYRDVNRVYHNSFVDYRSYRPQQVASVDANYFRANHELKLGFGWRKNSVESQSTWPGTGQLTIHLASYPENGLMLPLIVADAVNNSEGRYLSFYASDRISMDRLTIDVGVRFDRSTSSLLEASRGASPLVPDLLPALTAPALSNTHVFDVLAPRIGISYALGEDADTLLRASYGQFQSQLPAGAAQLLASPVSYSEVDFLAVDLNGDGLAQPDELLLDVGILAAIGFDPNNPTSTDSVNRISPDLSSPRTHELIFGIDRELPIPNSALTTSVTYRRFTNFSWAPLIGITSADYGVVDTLTGTLPAAVGRGSVSQDVYAPLPGVMLPPGNGGEERNRDGYHQAYWGWEANFIKRLSNRWMARIGYSWNDHREYFTDRAAAIIDPTPTPTSPKRDGGLVITSTGGSGKSDIYFLTPKFQFVANGLYQAPLGINIAANLLVRQGYGQPYYQEIQAHPRDATAFKDVLLAPDVGANRLPAIRSFDLRIGKEFRMDDVTLNIDLDWFNILNAGTVLGRQYDIGAAEGLTGPGRTLEIMNPGLLRLGFRVGF